jgi:hypothetical protein
VKYVMAYVWPSVEVDYTVPVPVLRKLAESIPVRMNDHEAELLVANVKARMET